MVYQIIININVSNNDASNWMSQTEITWKLCTILFECLNFYYLIFFFESIT